MAALMILAQPRVRLVTSLRLWRETIKFIPYSFTYGGRRLLSRWDKLSSGVQRQQSACPAAHDSSFCVLDYETL
jgi:hypothetical protein